MHPVMPQLLFEKAVNFLACMTLLQQMYQIAKCKPNSSQYQIKWTSRM